jgi:Holliday junction resolvase RusA-like endonuclease
MEIKIKPLSVNEAWQGKRFKTRTYAKYEKDVLLLLRPMFIPAGKLIVKLTFGFSSVSADIDNPTKLILDILQKKYKFDDKRIYRLEINKEIVKKGQEFFEFSINILE